MHVRTYTVLLTALCAATLLPLAQAQQTARAQPVASSSEPAVAERTVSEWLMRMHEASRKRTYVGTFVVSSGTGSLSSARIWHACDGAQQMERVESLTGAPRSIFRRNDQVITFLPESKVAVTETRESLGLFPNLLQTGDSAIPAFYGAKQVGSDRVAGFDADVVVLKPKDSLRYGYRIWSEKKSGLVVKLQTLDAEGRVLEQAAFSELQLDAPVKMEKLGQMMANTAGYRVETSAMVKTTALSEGWVLKNGVPGFQPMSCFRRSVGTGTAADGMVQWVFSDGLASVSLFVEAFELQRHLQEGSTAMGATQSLTRRIGDWWLTAVGEVPQATLKAFAHGLERKK
ncbi:sigma E regulatory protein, MucB/RseB [Rhodoferax sp. OV413]|uniref:MucB/RseB C-terminal domain-containing protein n=1 Tax=Rhodoferax sp. OV413 TaxID=1855285 RepID=UPI000882748A|nr:MucB/RseB C-terminal domain-containing protein [Rhodoferax sp. OV413]SDP18255.1 sigma E regulatory protein, MucB/RseB [Rhodoferax sp. OV413]